MLKAYEPIDHPAAWTASQLVRRNDWTVQFTGEEIRELDEALRSEADFPLPNLQKRFAAVQDSLENGSGAVFLRGFQTDGYTEEDCRRIFGEIVNQLGTPVSQSAKGERIFSVRDEGYADSDARARGPNTRKKLSFHTDRCDVIAFFCLRQAQNGGENEIVSSMAVYNRILATRPDLLEVLLEPFYYQRHNVDTGNEQPYCQQPIFSFHQGHFASAFLRVLIERAYASGEIPAMTAKQREALDLVEEIAAEPAMHLRFRQEPGDILLLNNWVTYHRRTEFENAPDPAQHRHILRIWLSPPNNRPLAHWFEANYGATQAGAVRGGMRAKIFGKNRAL